MSQASELEGRVFFIFFSRASAKSGRPARWTARGLFVSVPPGWGKGRRIRTVTARVVVALAAVGRVYPRSPGRGARPRGDSRREDSRSIARARGARLSRRRNPRLAFARRRQDLGMVGEGGWVRGSIAHLGKELVEPEDQVLVALEDGLDAFDDTLGVDPAGRGREGSASVERGRRGGPLEPTTSAREKSTRRSGFDCDRGAPLRLELLHDLEELIVRRLLVLEPLFEFSKVRQGLLFSLGVVRRRFLR